MWLTIVRGANQNYKHHLKDIRKKRRMVAFKHSDFLCGHSVTNKVIATWKNRCLYNNILINPKTVRSKTDIWYTKRVTINFTNEKYWIHFKCAHKIFLFT